MAFFLEESREFFPLAMGIGDSLKLPGQCPWKFYSIIKKKGYWDRMECKKN